jgi:ribosomal RNA-processing protein 12
LSILKATESAILEKGLVLCAQNYYAALFPLLDDESRDAALKNDQNRIIEFNVAVCYLLSFVFPCLDAEFLRKVYGEDGVFATLSHAMRRFHLVAPFVRSVCILSGCVLAAHSDADWQEEQSSLGELFVVILGWSIDSRPKVRKIAQETIIGLLSVAAARQLSTEFVSSALLNATRKDPTVAIQLMPLLKHLLPSVSADESESEACHDLGLDNLITGFLAALNMGNTLLTCAGYETIQSYAQTQTEVVEKRASGKTFGLVRRVFDGLLKAKPTCDLHELSVAFLPAFAQMTILMVHLHRILQRDPSETLRTALQTCCDYFTNASEGTLLTASGSALLAVFFNLFDGSTDNASATHYTALLHSVALPVFLETGLAAVPTQGRQLQNPLVSARFGVLVPILGRLVEILGASVSVSALGPLIVQIARLHDCRYLECRDEVVRLVSVLVRVSGLAEVLRLLPLNLVKSVGSDESPRAWLLPVLRDSVYNTSLQVWLDAICPMVSQVSARAESLRTVEKTHEARVWDTLAAQLVSLLPAVLSSYPTDFAASFPALSELLARLLNDNVQARPTLMAALLRFVQNSRSLLETMQLGGVDEVGLLRAPQSVEALEADLSALTTAMPQFLPILFNIYAATSASANSPNPEEDEDDDSAAASSDLTLRLIECLLGLTEEGVVGDYFSKTVGRLDRMRENASWAMLGTVLELSGTMIPHASAQSLVENFIPAVLPLIDGSSSISLQKKAYRAILRALTRDDVRAAVLGCAQKREALFAALTGASESLHSAAKKMRFRLLAVLTPDFPDESLLWIPQFLPEVLLGIKEVNHKTRTQAYELIVAWGRRMSLGGQFAGFDGSVRSASLQEYLNMVLAGLAGNTPHMISATIMALARIIFEFAATMKASGENDLVSSLTQDICLLLQSPSREIVKSAISFVKVALVILDSETLDPLLPGLTEGLLQWANVHHHQFKLQVRHLMERLLRRFGADRMEQATPLNHHPLLASIRKKREKSKKSQQPPKEDASSDKNPIIASSTVLSKAALSRASKRNQFLMNDTGLDNEDTLDESPRSNRNALSSRARFEQALNDDDSDSDYNDNRDESENHMEDEDKLSTVMSRKLNLNNKNNNSNMTSVTLKSAMSQRLPNMSRKQQESLKKNLQIAQGKKRQRSTEASDSDDNDQDSLDSDVRFGADGKLHIGQSSNEAATDMDKVFRSAMNSFKRSADGKHVKFARGSKAVHQDDYDNEETSNDNNARKHSTVAFSGVSRKSALTNLSASGKSMRSLASSSRPSQAPHSGSQFRAKKGSAGDAKRKGAQFDPYAYVPIQRKSGKHGGGKKENASEKYFMKNNKRARK